MTTKTALLTLGRLPPCIDLARSLHAAGWRVIVADPFRLHMCRTSRAVSAAHRVPAPAADAEAFRTALLELVARYDVSLIVPVSEETPHVAALHGRLPAGCALFCPPQDAVLTLHSKLRFARFAAANGLRVPATEPAGSADAATLQARMATIVKPEYSCSGRDTTRHAAGAQIEPPAEAAMVVQQAIVGREYSAFAIARAGRVLAACVYAARIRHGSVAVCFERVEQPAVDAWLTDLVRCSGHTGFIAIDAIVDDDGLAWAIECNPRASSGLHFVAAEGIAAAITDGGAARGRLRETRLLQEFWSNWTHYLASLRTPAERRRTGAALRAARDVSWQRSDPFVFLLAPISTWPIIGKAIRQRQTFAEVLALDIEYQAQRHG